MTVPSTVSSIGDWQKGWRSVTEQTVNVSFQCLSSVVKMWLSLWSIGGRSNPAVLRSTSEFICWATLQFAQQDWCLEASPSIHISKYHSSPSTDGINLNIFGLHLDTTILINIFVEYAFQPGYTCTNEYCTDTSCTNLVYKDPFSARDWRATITLSKRLRGDTFYNVYVIGNESAGEVWIRQVISKTKFQFTTVNKLYCLLS